MIPRLRLHGQLLAGNGLDGAHAVVSHLGAVQAQDYLAALWAIGLRMREAKEADVEHAIEERRIVRCWPMRGTLHFVAAEDARWMLELLAPRVLARHRMRLERDFELDPKTLRRCRSVAVRALRDGRALTRAELYAALDRAGISSAGGRGLHILFALAHERLICFGARRGKQPTVVLLDEWIPPSPPKPREEALAELARRYLTSHGPATADDLAWWSGLTAKEAREAVALAGPIAHTAATKFTARLLPAFDEYTVAYRDRTAIVDPAFAKRVNAGGGMISAVVVIDGLVVGNWKRTLRRDQSVAVDVSPFRELTARERKAIAAESARYARFLGCTVSS